MMETERTSGNGKTPEDNSLLCFENREQLLAGLRMRTETPWRPLVLRYIVGAVLAVLVASLLPALYVFTIVPQEWFSSSALSRLLWLHVWSVRGLFGVFGVFLLLFMVPYRAHQAAAQVWGGNFPDPQTIRHPLNLVAGFVIPEFAAGAALYAVFALVSSKIAMTTLPIRFAGLAYTFLLLVVFAAWSGTRRDVPAARVSRLWLAWAILGPPACAAVLFRMKEFSDFAPWLYLSGNPAIVKYLPILPADPTLIPWRLVLAFQLTVQVPLLVRAWDALRAACGRRSWLRGVKLWMLLLALCVNGVLLLGEYYTTVVPWPWPPTRHFCWIAAVLLYAATSLCSPSRARLERGLRRPEGKPSWLDDDAPAGMLLVVIAAISTAAHACSLLVLNPSFSVGRLDAHLLVCFTFLAVALAVQWLFAAPGTAGPLLLIAGGLAWHQWPFLSRDFPPSALVIQSLYPYGLVNECMHMIYLRQTELMAARMHVAILLSAELVCVFSALLAVEYWWLRQRVAARGLTDPHEGTHG